MVFLAQNMLRGQEELVVLSSPTDPASNLAEMQSFCFMNETSKKHISPEGIQWCYELIEKSWRKGVPLELPPVPTPAFFQAGGASYNDDDDYGAYSGQPRQVNGASVGLKDEIPWLISKLESRFGRSPLHFQLISSEAKGEKLEDVNSDDGDYEELSAWEFSVPERSSRDPDLEYSGSGDDREGSDDSGGGGDAGDGSATDHLYNDAGLQPPSQQRVLLSIQDEEALARALACVYLQVGTGG
jgi:hypothetical protein